jgi:hypothetical protein
MPESFTQDQHTTEKVPYTPPAHKRYEVSRDPITQERIAYMRDLQKQLSTDFGVEIGLSLFGSITKGKELISEEVANATDIDCVFYFSGDEVAKKYDRLVVEFPAMSKYYHGSDNDLEIYRDQHRGLAFKCFLKFEYLPELLKNADSAKPEVNADVVWLSVKYLTNIAYQLEELEGNSFFGTGGLAEIVRLFQLDVGGVLPKYRAIFLNALAKESEPMQEKVWGLILRKIRSDERYKGESSIQHLPETFSEAYTKYVHKVTIDTYHVNVI